MPAQPTDIVWTDYSANHWVGCAKVSSGCRNCWAARIAARHDRTPEPWTIANIDANLRVYDEDIAADLSRLDPGWCFYPSSSDPFLPWLPKTAEVDYWHSIEQNDHLYFQVLTKWGPEVDRSEQDAYPDEYEPTVTVDPLPDHVMLGVTVETPLRAYRLDWLRKQPAATKFVSFEPLLDGFDWRRLDLSGIDWVIVGGESEQSLEKRREMDPSWAIDLLQAARSYSIPYLFKQHSGAYAEADRELMLPGIPPRTFTEFPTPPGDLPVQPVVG